MSQLAQIISRLRIKGATSEGGDAQYSDYLVKLDADGKLSIEVIPDAIFTEVVTVANQAARLALAGTVDQGDMVIQTDVKSTYILTTGTGSLDGDWTAIAITEFPNALQVAFTATGSIAATNVQAAIAELDGDVTTHVANVSNPHSVTKSQVGLANVDNTSDVNKPISTATQTALDLKADDADLTAHTSNTSNPHSVTATQTAFTPTGAIAATTVQAAIAELDTEKLNVSLLPSTSKLVYVGTDANATDTRTSLSKYDPFRPFATLDAAMIASASGDTIVVLPGTYTPNAITWTSGVRIHCTPGAVLTYGGTLTGGMLRATTGGGTYKLTGNAVINVQSSNVASFVALTGQVITVEIEVDTVNVSGNSNSSALDWAILAGLTNKVLFKAKEVNVTLGYVYNASSGGAAAAVLFDIDTINITSTGNGFAVLYHGIQINARKVNLDAANRYFISVLSLNNPDYVILNVDNFIMTNGAAGIGITSDACKVIANIQYAEVTQAVFGLFYVQQYALAELNARIGKFQTNSEQVVYAEGGKTMVYVGKYNSPSSAFVLVQGGEYSPTLLFHFGGFYECQSSPVYTVTTFDNLTTVQIEGGTTLLSTSGTIETTSGIYNLGIIGDAVSNTSPVATPGYGTIINAIPWS